MLKKERERFDVRSVPVKDVGYKKIGSSTRNDILGLLALFGLGQQKNGGRDLFAAALVHVTFDFELVESEWKKRRRKKREAPIPRKLLLNSRLRIINFNDFYF